jgi:hypothetical protein
MAPAHRIAQVRLTPVGACVVGISGALLLAGVDLLVSPGLGLVFVVTATALCFWVSARARREALFTAAVLPPLAFLAAAVLAGLIGRGVSAAAGTGAFVDSLQTLAATAPGLYVATAAGAGLAVLRRILSGPRRLDHTRRSSSAGRSVGATQSVTGDRRRPTSDQGIPPSGTGRPRPMPADPPYEADLDGLGRDEADPAAAQADAAWAARRSRRSS